MSVQNAEKYESLINQIEEVPSPDRKSYHDLQAQLINIKGFTSELSNSINDIRRAMTESDLPPSFVERLSNITENDLVPCLRFIEQASSNLDERITEHFQNEES